MCFFPETHYDFVYNATVLIRYQIYMTNITSKWQNHILSSGRKQILTNVFCKKLLAWQVFKNRNCSPLLQVFPSVLTFRFVFAVLFIPSFNVLIGYFCCIQFGDGSHCFGFDTLCDISPLNSSRYWRVFNQQSLMWYQRFL